MVGLTQVAARMSLFDKGSDGQRGRGWNRTDSKPIAPKMQNHARTSAIWLACSLLAISVLAFQQQSGEANTEESPAGGRWTVDGVWLGAAPEQLHHRLEPDEFLKGWTSWRGQEVMSYGQEMVFAYPGKGVVRCEGRKLRLGSRLLLQTGDSTDRLKTILGTDYKVRGAMGDCTQDPCYWYFFRRPNCVISVLVSNDDYIRECMPKVARERLSKVWAVELHRPKLRELIDQSIETN